MKKYFYTGLMILTGAMAVSFLIKAETESLKPGVYGTCGCDQTEDDARMELTLNDDNSFRFFDNTGVALTDISGEYRTEKNVIQLLGIEKNSANLITNWKRENEFPCITGRKGLSFIRLCHLDSCNK